MPNPKPKKTIMNIEDLTIKQAREIAGLFGGAAQAPHPFNVGGNYFIRTVTHHLTGQLDAVHATELVLSKAAWIADDGRFADAMKTGEFAEVEPFPAERSVIVGRGSIIDAVEIPALPAVQK